MRITFLGAAQTVTGSRFLIEHNHKRILVDCGLFQGPKELRLLNWAPFPEANLVDTVVLTHAHIDHSGYLPKLAQDGFRGKVISTQATHALCEILLPDSGRLQEEDARFANLTKHSVHDPALPLYTEADALRVLTLFETRPEGTWFTLTPDLSARFLRAGHILGSSIVQISFALNDKQHVLTFTGDLGNGRSFILKDPLTITETDTLVIESTYGDRAQSKSDPCETLAQIIKKVLGRGGTLVIPAFALGRTQEIIYIIHCLEQEGRIPIYDVYLDSPMAESVTEIYKKLDGDLKIPHQLYDGFNFSTGNFHVIGKAEQSMQLCLNRHPKIVISAAGMLTGGRVMHHLKTQLPKAESGVLFVGYQAEGTKGLLLKNGLRSLRIHHQEIPVEAEIFSIDSLSAHADSDDLIAWVKHIERKPQTTYLVHGEKNAQQTLAYRLVHECKLLPPIIPRLGESFELR